MAAAGASFAQSSVEIYGIIDQAYTNTTIKASDTGFAAKATIANSGTQSGLATQRLGFRGIEDLGGGLKAKFQVENSLSAGGADKNGFGSRPTFVGLEGSFGTILLGRQDTPLLKAVVPQLAGGANNMVGQIMWSPFAGAGALTSLSALSALTSTVIADAGFGRIARETTIDKAIDYITPTFNGFSAELQVGQNDAKLTGDATTGNAKTDDTGLNVKYAAGPLTLNAGTHNQKVTANDVVTRKNVNNYVGATYDLSVANLSLQHGTSKSNAAAGEFYNNKGTQLGVQVPVSTTIAAFASVGTGTRTISELYKLKQSSVQVGATYAFSKRTKVYAAYGQQQLKGDNDATNGVKWTENQFGLGVNHSF
ncbi:MAG: porin [Limnohabitans sp.]